MRKHSRIVTTVLVASLLLAGCGKKEEPVQMEEKAPVEKTASLDDLVTEPEQVEEVIEDEVETTTQNEVTTIAELKQKYGVDDSNYIKPFYNVEQTTQFNFRFNSRVEPILAVTVHTDPKCEMSSTVYQINSAYDNGKGYDIVVKPGSPVLNTKDRESGELDNYNWGNAPVYYLCIRYDLNADKPTELKEPIVVPFTVKNNLSTPNLTAKVSTDGKFGLAWNKVENAVKYNIYRANRVRPTSPAYEMTRSECAYVGDHLELLKSVDGDTTSFEDFNNDGNDNCQLDSNGFITNENFFELGSYYVTAVDANGHESNFSLAVEGWQHAANLPKSFDQYRFFKKNDAGYVTYLPETVPVDMVDGSRNYFPVSYTKIDESMNGYATYKYEIKGTKLTGKVTYYREDKIYSPYIDSSYNFNQDLYVVKNNIDIIPNINVNTLTDSSYTNVNMNLGQVVNRDGSTAVKYSHDALMKRADVEAARIVNDGVYTVEEGPRAMLSLGNASKDNNTTVEENKDTTNEEIEDEQPEEKVDEILENDIEEIGQGTPGITEITSENLVDEQINSTYKQLEAAEKQEIPTTEALVFASSPEEEYLALNMINAISNIDLSGFPRLQNAEYLADVMMKAVYQNPYIVGFDSCEYDFNTQMLIVHYQFEASDIKSKQEQIIAEANNIKASIIKDGMSDEEKVNAIWKYFEDNTKYDTAALEFAEANGFEDIRGFEDSFNSYGIMCNKVGVCQSYAYCCKILLSMCDVNSITLTGYMDTTLPHAWNAVYLDGAWRWIDMTNNYTNSGIPYMLYQTSSDYAHKAAYSLDDYYALNTNLYEVMSDDNSKDWYVTHNAYAKSEDELVELLIKNYDTYEDCVCVKYDIEPSYSESFMIKLAKGLEGKGLTTEQIYNTRMGYVHGIFVMKK